MQTWTQVIYYLWKTILTGSFHLLSVFLYFDSLPVFLFEGLEEMFHDIVLHFPLPLCEGSAHCIQVLLQHGSVIHGYQSGRDLWEEGVCVWTELSFHQESPSCRLTTLLTSGYSGKIALHMHHYTHHNNLVDLRFFIRWHVMCLCMYDKHVYRQCQLYTPLVFFACIHSRFLTW